MACMKLQPAKSCICDRNRTIRSIKFCLCQKLKISRNLLNISDKICQNLYVMNVYNVKQFVEIAKCIKFIVTTSPFPVEFPDKDTNNRRCLFWFFVSVASVAEILCVFFLVFFQSCIHLNSSHRICCNLRSLCSSGNATLAIMFLCSHVFC